MKRTASIKQRSLIAVKSRNREDLGFSMMRMIPKDEASLQSSAVKNASSHPTNSRCLALWWFKMLRLVRENTAQGVPMCTYETWNLLRICFTAC